MPILIGQIDFQSSTDGGDSEVHKSILAFHLDHADAIPFTVPGTGGCPQRLQLGDRWDTLPLSSRSVQGFQSRSQRHLHLSSSHPLSTRYHYFYSLSSAMSLEKKPLDNSATISSAARTLQPLTTSRPNHPNLFSSFHALSRLSLRLPLARRYYKLLSALTILLIVGYVGWSWKGDSTPPTYKSWRKRERNLPQHDVGLPFPQGKEGRYIYMANHVISTCLLPVQ